MSGRSRKIAVLAALAGAFALCASLAHAELTARGDLFVRFDGGIAPDALPRHARAPISVRIEGTIRTLSGARPPALRRIAVAINRGGRLDATGLPLCPRDKIEPSTTAEAVSRCGDAVVGHGRYVADIAFPEQAVFTSRGRIVAFNAKVNGQRAILAHVYGAKPVPFTRIIVFHVHESRGTYGTILTGFLPPSLNRWGYLRQISLNLHRDYTFHGRRRSYLTAACDAPAGFSAAVFAFAHASMGFADGRTLSSTLSRTCRVRGG